MNPARAPCTPPRPVPARSPPLSGVAACLAAALVQAGCALGPDFHRPTAPAAAYAAPSATAGKEHLAYGAEVAADWYTLFGSPRLDGLVRSALEANPDLEAARHNLRAGQFELRAIVGRALPQAEFDGRAARAKVNGSLLYEPAENFQATADQYALGPSLAYDLDVFGAIRRGIEAQAALTAGIEHQAANVYVTLVDQVVITSFDLAATAREIEVTRELLDDLQQQFDLTRTLENAGKIARSDTLQAQAQLETTRATLPNLEKQRDIYRNALLRLLGSALGTPLSGEPTLHDFALPADLPVSLPAQLVRQRPDVLAAEDALHAASAGIGIAEAARLPSLSISADTMQQSIRTSDLFTRPAQTWTAGLGLSVPLFEGGRLLAREREAKERFLATAAQYRSTVLGAFVEVSDALQGIGHDADSFAAHAIALEAARSNRDLARDQYRRGKVSELVVLTAEQQYQNAALGQVQADAQRFVDVAELFRALGGGWWHDREAIRRTRVDYEAEAARDR